MSGEGDRKGLSPASVNEEALRALWGDSQGFIWQPVIGIAFFQRGLMEVGQAGGRKLED